MLRVNVCDSQTPRKVIVMKLSEYTNLYQATYVVKQICLQTGCAATLKIRHKQAGYIDKHH